MRALIRRHERALLRQQEAQDRLCRVLHPLLGPGAQGRCASELLGLEMMKGQEWWMLREVRNSATTCTFYCTQTATRCGACRTQSFRAFRGVRPRLTLQFEGLGLELHDGRTILAAVTGRWEAWAGWVVGLGWVVRRV